MAEKEEGQERGKEEETEREVEGGREAGKRTIVELFNESINTDEPP